MGKTYEDTITTHITSQEQEEDEEDIRQEYIRQMIECERAYQLAKCCCLCEMPLKIFPSHTEGNNPNPVTDVGKCCDSCNHARVIPARIQARNQDSCGMTRRFTNL